MADTDALKQKLRFDPTYSIDCLTDGSEGTGDGTIFLSVWKQVDLDDIHRFASEVPAARYAITGLGDLTSRLASDQRYKLHNVKAVFCSTNAGLWGLPTLQIVLHQAGAAELSIVSCSSEKVEALIDLLEGRRQNPVCHLCQVPESTESWWKVYEDMYITAYAKRVDEDANSESVAYCYALNHVDGTKEAVLVLPPGCSGKLEKFDDDLLEQFTTKKLILLRSQAPTDPKFPCYVTSPSDGAFTHNMLSRAQAQSRFLHSIQPDIFPLVEKEVTSLVSDSTLRTGESIVFGGSRLERVDRVSSEAIRFEESMRGRVESCIRNALLDSEDDANEIDLEEEELDGDNDSIDDSFCKLHLHVLGTGCASPSPYRNASGYLFRLAEDAAVVFEAGEGIVSQIGRYVPGFDLSSIKIIWISHAHWDHYGGLTSLLTAIRASKDSNDPSTKRTRTEYCFPIVMAPPKVLQYLESSLKTTSKCDYTSITLGDEVLSGEVIRVLSSLGIESLKNFRVKHSCRDAFGFLMKVGVGTDTRSIAFSGDTIPDFRLIDACRYVKVNLLIHEATYADEEKEMAKTKMHSTCGQAALVAEAVSARKLLLTHFSQRYSFIPDLDLQDYNIPAIVAYDGMTFPI